MLKTHMAGCLLATAFMALPVLAQTSTAPANPPSATAPNQNPSTSAPSGMSAPIITEQSTSQWRASKLVGVNVYGTDDKKIGDIREVLLNHDGTAEAVVIGVGGFLGVGEKDVAVPFKSLEWRTEPRPAVASPVTSPNGIAVPGTTVPGSTAPGVPAGSVAQRDSATIAASRGYPDRAVLAMTKADLQNAPTFRYASETRATTTAPATAPIAPNRPATAPRP